MLDKETMEKLDGLKRPGVSRSFLVREAIQNYVKKRKTKGENFDG